jgi:hypothetical protein
MPRSVVVALGGRGQFCVCKVLTIGETIRFHMKSVFGES